MKYPISRERLKNEVDKVKEQHLEIVYRFIKEISEDQEQTPLIKPGKDFIWDEFINETYGSLADAPIRRWNEGPSLSPTD